MDLKDLPALLTAEQAADYLGVSRSAIYSWCRAKKMPGIKLNGTWRVRKEAFVEWLNEQERASCGTGV